MKEQKEEEDEFEGRERSAAKSVWHKQESESLTIEKPREKKAKDDSKKFKTAEKT